MRPNTPSSILTRLNLGNTSAKDAFLRALELYRENKTFCVPDAALEILSRCGDQTPFVLLGRSDFTGNFIDGVGARARVLNVVDDFKGHRGEQFRGVDIISTDKFLDMVKSNPDIIALNGCRFDYSRRFFDDLCRNHGIPHLNHEQAMRALGLNATMDHRMADWGDVIAARSEEYARLEERMVDQCSIDTLYGVLTFHLTGNPEWYLNIARPYSTLYFRSGLFSFSDHEKMVDCGASIGESTTALIGVTRGQFDHAWMIEPDKYNLATLRGLLRKYAGTPIAEKLSLHPVAAGEAAGDVPFLHLGGHGSTILSSASAVSEAVRVETIDAIVDARPTIIKMDVEGFEMAALRGAARTIADARPKLMLSAYHRSGDLLDIPAYIDTLAPDYRIGLRHHTEDRWDTCLYFF